MTTNELIEEMMLDTDKLKKELMSELYDNSIELAKDIIDLAKKNDLLNTQEFINWQDELNNLSQLITK
jgi:hypothetical protein